MSPEVDEWIGKVPSSQVGMAESLEVRLHCCLGCGHIRDSRLDIESCYSADTEHISWMIPNSSKRFLSYHPPYRPTLKTIPGGDGLSCFMAIPSCCARKGDPPQPQLESSLFDSSYGRQTMRPSATRSRPPSPTFDQENVSTSSRRRPSHPFSSRSGFRPSPAPASTGAGASLNSLLRDKGKEREKDRNMVGVFDAFS